MCSHCHQQVEIRNWWWSPGFGDVHRCRAAQTQTVSFDVLSHVTKLCSSERLDNTSSFWQRSVCGQMHLNIRREREQSALVNLEPVEELSVINRDNQLPAKSSTCYANTQTHTHTVSTLLTVLLYKVLGYLHPNLTGESFLMNWTPHASW